MPDTVIPPAHRDVRALLSVFAGGAAGTALRAGIGVVLPPTAGAWPWSTFLVNVTGAFLLGLLLETLTHRGPDAGRLRDLRLTLGTGFLGGYTTYSALTVETIRLAPMLALGYAATTVVTGVLAAGSGIFAARRARRMSA